MFDWRQRFWWLIWRKHSPDRFLSKPCKNYCGGKSIMLLQARMCRQHWALSSCIGFCFGRIDLKAQRVKQHLFPNCRPSLSCFWLSKGNPSIPLPQSTLFLLLSFTMGPPSHFQQRTILKVYQQLLVNPFLLLCALFSGVPFPSSSPPRGLLERRALSWPCGEKMAEFIPCCVGDNTPERDTSRLRLQVEDSFLAFSLSPRLQCRH